MVLRCTSKVLKLLGVSTRELVDVPSTPDDWYLNFLWIDRRRCLLLTHAGTLFSVFIPAVRKEQLRPIGPTLIAHIRGALKDEQLPDGALDPLDAAEPLIAKTASKRILGFMVDMAFSCEYTVVMAGGLASCNTGELNRTLQRTPHNMDGHGYYALPIDLVGDRRTGAAR